MDGEVDVALLGERLVPRRRRVLAALPRRSREALDRLQRDVALGARPRQLLERLRVARVLHLHVVVRAQHAVEAEPLEAARVHLRDREPVAGDADERDQALAAGLDRRLQRAAGAERDVPLDHVDEVVELDRVDVVDAEPLERAVDLLLRLRVGALAGLGRQEELVLREPRGDPQLRVAIGGGDVDVVDAVLEQQLERAVRIGLGGLGQRRGTEDHAAGLVSRRAEGGALDHGGEGTWARLWRVRS